MPGLYYPFVFECSNCGTETTIERDDIQDLATNPDSINALEITLQRRGWLRDDIKGLLFCPDCIGANESNEPFSTSKRSAPPGTIRPTARAGLA